MGGLRFTQPISTFKLVVRETHPTIVCFLDEAINGNVETGRALSLPVMCLGLLTPRFNQLIVVDRHALWFLVVEFGLRCTGLFQPFFG